MNKEKLKTLKDLERDFKLKLYEDDRGTSGFQFKFLKLDELKAEAVRWAKKLKEEDDYDKHNYSDIISLKDFKKTDDSENGVGISWAECSDIQAIINFIKYLFNLTEEELKDE